MNENTGVQIGINNGLIIGFSMVILYLGVYFVNAELLFNNWLAFGSFVAIVLFMVKAATENRKALGNYASFKQVLQPAFVCFIVAQTINAAFNYLLYNFIDTSLYVILQNYTIELTRSMFEGLMSASELNEQIEKIKSEDNQITIASSIIGLLWTSTVGFILASIVALFTSKKPPHGQYQNTEMQTPIDA